MAGIRERIVQLTVRARDFLSKDLAPATDAMRPSRRASFTSSGRLSSLRSPTCTAPIETAAGPNAKASGPIAAPPPISPPAEARPDMMPAPLTPATEPTAPTTPAVAPSDVAAAAPVVVNDDTIRTC